MEMISRISSPLSESWVSWVMLLLLIFFVINRMYLPEISGVIRGVSSRGDRTYASRDNRPYITWLYKIGTLALGVHLVWVRNEDGIVCGDFGIIVGILTCVLLLQWLLVHITARVFLTHRQVENAIEQRTMISNAICALIMPLLLVFLYQIDVLNGILIAILLIGYVGVIFVRALQLFYKNLLTVLYILLYIISLEVIPLVGIVLWIQNII